MGHSVYQLIDAMQAADHAEGVEAAFSDFVRDRGFTVYMCGELSGAPIRRNPPLVFGNWPEEWKKHYEANGYLFKDPTIARVLRDTAPFSFAEEAQRVGISKEARNVMEEATDFGLKVGLAVPIHGNGTYVAALSVAGNHGDLSKHARADIHMAAIYCHVCLRSLWNDAYRSNNVTPMLSKRQRQCLGWVAAGKSDWEIARLVGISEHTVHRHIEEAKRRYGVTTRIQAVVSAIERNEFENWPVKSASHESKTA